MRKSLFLFISLFLFGTLGAEGMISTNTTTESPVIKPSYTNDTTFITRLYRRTYYIMKHSRAFRNYTYQDAVNWVNEAETFQAPEDLVQRFPYYLAGYDFDDRPVWVSEAGKYRVSDLIERALDLHPIFEKMAFQAAVNVIKSLVAKSSPERKIRQFVLIIDCEGLDMKVAISDFNRFFEYQEWPRLMKLGLSIGDLYLDLGVKGVGQVILINANYVAKMFLDFSRPIIGQLIERLVVLGTNRYKWKAELRRLLPVETIPYWYGGSPDFKPLAVYG